MTVDHDGREYIKLQYARMLRDRLVANFNMRFIHEHYMREQDTLQKFTVALRAYLGLPDDKKFLDSLLIMEAPASDELIQKLEALTGPHGHAFYKALVARGILPEMKNSRTV